MQNGNLHIAQLNGSRFHFYSLEMVGFFMHFLFMSVSVIILGAWLSGRLAADDGRRRLVVLDEGWAVLADPAAVNDTERRGL